jgi:hypothetical protein
VKSEGEVPEEDPMETKATTQVSSTTFRLEHAVRRTLRATPARVWSLLTDAGRFSEWNSTVRRLDGPIEFGRKLRIEVAAAPGRVFTPRVTEFSPDRSMTWTDGLAPMFSGVRTFTLSAKDGNTEFEMREALTGIMLPLVRRSLPDFGPIFETYADDLARAAESAR